MSGAIHPTAFIAPGAAVMGDVTIGADASVWYGAVLRGDMAPITIGAETCLQDGTIAHVDDDAPCVIGRRVGVGHRVILHGCRVEDECLIGMGSVLLNHVTIGSGSVIAGISRNQSPSSHIPKSGKSPRSTTASSLASPPRC